MKLAEKMELAERILSDAADIIDAGWCQSAPRLNQAGVPLRWNDPPSPGDRICLTTAIGVALDRLGLDLSQRASVALLVLNALTQETEAVSLPHWNDAPGRIAVSLPHWNDAPGRIKEEVSGACRNAKRHLWFPEMGAEGVA